MLLEELINVTIHQNYVRYSEDLRLTLPEEKSIHRKNVNAMIFFGSE